MKDHLCIGQVLNLKKYNRISKLSDFKDKEFFIIQAKSIKGNDKEGFNLKIRDLDMNEVNVSTYSKTIVREIKDLLILVKHTDGEFEKEIKCKLEISPVKLNNGSYSERFKLV